RRTSWVLVARSATVGEMRDGVMQLIFETDGLRTAFRSGRHDENVALALSQTLGVNVRVVGITAAEDGSAPAAGAPEQATPKQATPEPAAPEMVHRPPGPGPRGVTDSTPTAGPRTPTAGPRVSAASAATASSATASATAPAVEDDDAPSPDDEDAEDSGLMGIPVIERILGGRVVDEEPS
ncbi:MAG: hypothetical protein LPK38_01720, partial [Actinomycetes bacterium]|nr:hypothetical protein [Actinomycetes bacterium]MDX5380033.1 hypothetical protein [Actinomycetes bacterium]MDX5398580.1 hypothetical protein [Actinomycetes bacterium]MDX5449736.1 hypothetical protein [Actinomycetes bacterium]